MDLLDSGSAESYAAKKKPARATLDAQTTRDRARPRPKHAPQCCGRSPSRLATGRARKDLRQAEHSIANVQNNVHLGHIHISYRYGVTVLMTLLGVFKTKAVLSGPAGHRLSPPPHNPTRPRERATPDRAAALGAPGERRGTTAKLGEGSVKRCLPGCRR